jgi:hypothetical protein
MLADEMHVSEGRIIALANDLATHWGRNRVWTVLPDYHPVINPAAVTVIKQSYGAAPSRCRAYGKQGPQLRFPVRRAA